MKPLRIPYAIDIERDRPFSAEELGRVMQDPTSDLRLRATAKKDTKARKAATFLCPACAGRLYPRAPKATGRYFWSHSAGGAASCPLEKKHKLTPDEINSIIFDGRPEGEEHKKLVALLVRLAESDGGIDRASISTNAYEPPTPEMRAEFPHGRFPDVQFQLGDLQVVLEAQLATIMLHSINGRRAFYDKKGARLLWVMRNFDPSGPLRASVRDIIADQRGALFALDSETEARARAEGRFLLRAWTSDTAGAWTSEIVSISKAAELAEPISKAEVDARRWADDFKGRWIAAFKGRSYLAVEEPVPRAMIDELVDKAGVQRVSDGSEWHRLFCVVRLLISLEAGVVTASGHPKLLSIANDFNANGGHSAIDLVRKALERWQPDLLQRPSMVNALARAKETLRAKNEAPLGRLSPIGRIRDVLFPDWKLS